MRAEVNVAVDPELSVEKGHAVAREVNHQLLHHLRYLDAAIVHVDPVQEAGEEHHRITAHRHDGLPPTRTRKWRTSENSTPEVQLPRTLYRRSSQNASSRKVGE